MADIVWTDVTDLQANLSGVSDGAQAKILGYVNNGLNPNAFGGPSSERYTLARCYLAAHLGELARRNGERAVSSETYGTSAVSIAYGASAESLQQTSWGGEYASMLAASPLRVGGGRCR